MPAAKGSKRQSKAPATEAKKQKTDPTLSTVIQSIEKADLPESCRALLTAVAPTCFASAANERHPHQATIVSWIGDVLDGMRAKLQDAVDEANQAASGADATKEGLEGKVKESTDALSASMEAIVVAANGLTASTEGVTAAKTGVSGAQIEQVKAIGKVEVLKKEKQTLESALSDDLQLLKQEEGFQADKHAKTLTPIAKKLRLEESLVVALPAACSKPPSARGPFDTAVLDQVESGIMSKVKELEAELAAATSAEDDAKQALAAAQADLEGAQQKKQAAQDGLEAAEAQKTHAKTALSEAEAALVAFNRSRAPEEKLRKEKVSALENFTSHNLECFKTLKDKEAPAAASAGA